MPCVELKDVGFAAKSGSWRGSTKFPKNLGISHTGNLHTMPKENKRRGRRDEKKNEKKRKGREEAEAENTSKKRKFEDGADFIALAGQQENGDGQQENIGGMRDIPFYGLLNTDEQEYFKRADEMLELNQFNSAEGEHQYS
jgi:hypothetical protein